MNDSRVSAQFAPLFWLPVFVGAVSGFAGGWGASWWSTSATEPSSRPGASVGTTPGPNGELERRIAELEERWALASHSLPRQHSGTPRQGEAGAAAPASDRALAPLNASALEAAVREVLARIEDEELQSREARRTHREEERIRGFVSLLGQKASLDESTIHEVAAILVAKREELRAEKDALAVADASAQLTPRQRKDRRRQLEEKVGSEVDRALFEVLGAEGLETYRALAKEERVELDD